MSSTSSPTDHNDNNDHHVHFDHKSIRDDFEEDNSITYQKSTIGDCIIIHLGFLQIQHRYKIELKLPLTLFAENNHNIQLIQDDEIIPNIYCKIIEFLGKHNDDKTDYLEMNVEFLAHKEKLLKEELKLINSKNNNEKFKFIFNARVLGRGKGTPMLRNGVHCIGIEADEESEASDWQGFSRSDTDL